MYIQIRKKLTKSILNQEEDQMDTKLESLELSIKENDLTMHNSLFSFKDYKLLDTKNNQFSYNL